MKKLFILTILIALTVLIQTAKAQLETIGGGIVLGTGGKYNFDEVEYFSKSFGFDVRASFNYNKKLKIVPDFKFYLPNKNDNFQVGGSKVTAFALNINAHYILNSRSRDNYKLYLLAGAHVGAWTISDNSLAITEPRDINEFKIFPGGNVGAGMKFDFGGRVNFFAEVKYVIAQTSQLVFTPGLTYNI